MSELNKLKSIHFAALLLGCLALSLAPIFVRFCDTPSSSITFWRMLISTPIFALVWWVLPAQKQTSQTLSLKPSLKDYGCLILAGIAFALDLVFWNLSVVLTTIANSTLFVNFASIFVALLSWQCLKKAPSKGLFIGMMVAILGSLFLVWPHLSFQSSLLGDGLGLLAAFFYGLYLLCIQIVRPRFNTVSIMTITGLVTVLTALMVAFLFDHSLTVNDAQTWIAIFGLAIVVQLVGQSLIAFSLISLSATLSAIVLLLQPVLAALLAVWLFGENLVIIQILGMLVVLFGVGYAKLSAVPEKNTGDLK